MVALDRGANGGERLLAVGDEIGDLLQVALHAVLVKARNPLAQFLLRPRLCSETGPAPRQEDDPSCVRMRISSSLGSLGPLRA